MLQLTKFTTRDRCLPPKLSTGRPSRSPASLPLPLSVATSSAPAWEVPKHDSTLPLAPVGMGGRWSAASLPPVLRSHDPSGGTPIPPIHATINEVHHPRPMPTTATLTLIGATLAATAEVEPTLIAEDIRTMHKTDLGAEILRLIVRDDLGGAANVIANALWVNL